MNYDEAIRFLESFIDYEKIGGSYYTEAREELASMRRLLELIGNPERDLACVHIAGTKGKGSTAAMTASILAAAGQKTGLYTSPHLIDFRERIQVNGQMISREDCAAHVTAMADAAIAARADPAVGELSFFEVYTALAFRYFREQQCDMVVLEPGLGGRLDATNVALPRVCGITLIGHDHEAILGDTLEQIAAEKAGILKPSVPVVVAPQEPEAETVIAEIAERQEAPTYWLCEQEAGRARGRELLFRPLEQGRGQSAFSLQGVSRSYARLSSPLLGRHQVTNAAMAVIVAELYAQGGFELPSETVVRGLRQTRWPGRFQIVARNPAVVLDGAHNPESALALRQALQEHLQYERLAIVFGGMADHNLRAVAETLFPLAERVVLTRARNPRAAPPEELLELTGDLCAQVATAESVPEALQRARAAAGREDAVVVTGSLYVVGEALAAHQAELGADFAG
jgi:dihydrofolate synthase/folylpolyglutamate synthase